MSSPKIDFIQRYILIPMQPIFDFFNSLGIHEMTVIGVPGIIIFLLALKGKNKKSSTSIALIFLLSMFIILVLYYQIGMLMEMSSNDVGNK